MLGASDYGSLAALLSAFIILMVPGSALQIAVARDVSTAAASGDANAGAGVRRWLGQLLIATVVVALLAIPLRHVLAAILNVEEDWAAAAVPLTAMLWMVVSRGARRASGPPALPARGLEHHRRGGRTARRSRSCSWASGSA